MNHYGIKTKSYHYLIFFLSLFSFPLHNKTCIILYNIIKVYCNIICIIQISHQTFCNHIIDNCDLIIVVPGRHNELKCNSNNNINNKNQKQRYHGCSSGSRRVMDLDLNNWIYNNKLPKKKKKQLNFRLSAYR